MADYQEIYLKLFRAAEKATKLLIQAQQECEELYLAAEEENIISILKEKGDTDQTEDHSDWIRSV